MVHPSTIKKNRRGWVYPGAPRVTIVVASIEPRTLGAAMKDRSWHDTERHSRAGRLLGCCRLKARQWSW